MNNKTTFRPRLPEFLKQQLPQTEAFGAVKKNLRDFRLHTVCEEANCPNRTHCYDRGTLAFQILGDICTRSCGFCAETYGKTGRPVDATEPARLAETAKRLKLKHVVVTSPARDDLQDGGADQFARVVRELHLQLPNVTVEVLVPDFEGSEESLQTVFNSRPNIFNHNLETVRRLSPRVRPRAAYERSLEVLRKSHGSGLNTKSGLMLGLGESRSEVDETLKDLRTAGVDLITIGQYLPPSPHHLPLERIYTPAEFDEVGQEALELGFRFVSSGPLVRSSFHADEAALVTKCVIPAKAGI